MKRLNFKKWFDRNRLFLSWKHRGFECLAHEEQRLKADGTTRWCCVVKLNAKAMRLWIEAPHQTNEISSPPEAMTFCEDMVDALLSAKGGAS